MSNELNAMESYKETAENISVALNKIKANLSQDYVNCVHKCNVDFADVGTLKKVYSDLVDIAQFLNIDLPKSI